MQAKAVGVELINDYSRLCVLIIQFHSLMVIEEGRAERARKKIKTKKQINTEEAVFLRVCFFVCFAVAYFICTVNP